MQSGAEKRGWKNLQEEELLTGDAWLEIHGNFIYYIHESVYLNMLQPIL